MTALGHWTWYAYVRALAGCENPPLVNLQLLRAECTQKDKLQFLDQPV